MYNNDMDIFEVSRVVDQKNFSNIKRALLVIHSSTLDIYLHLF